MDISYYKKYEPIFGSWKIVREIGEGSFGKVFEIEREDFGYTYKAALKAITIPQSQSEVKSVLADGMDEESATSYFKGCVEELVKEFAIMSGLKGHSNIVSYEDHIVVQHDENIGWDILIRMELLTPLVDYIRTKTLDRREVIKLGIDICRALEACNASNIVHRDIKPENIFVSKLGDFKLGDFGIAKTVEKTTGGLSKKGTYTYMAPEIYKGEAYGPNVDIYSMGIVLYRFMNNQRTPFLPAYPEVIKFNDKEMALGRRINGEAIPAPANADKTLADIILKACAYNPKDRYASPTEMRLALESLGEKSAVSAPAVEKKIEDISEIETVSDTEVETEKTVSLFGAAEGKKTIESNSEVETVNEAEEENQKTVSVFGTAEEAETIHDAEAATDKTVLELSSVSVEEETSTETADENDEKQKPIKERKKKKTPIIAAIAAVLAMFAIAFFPKKGPTDITAISAGDDHTVALKTDITAISAGFDHTVALKKDGTVVATGDNNFDQCGVAGWTDIIAVSACNHRTVGLKSNGTVVATGADYFNVDWTDIVAISAGVWHTVGLKSDGTVVAQSVILDLDETDFGECDVDNWTDVVAISANDFYTVGLKSDGTVVATGDNDYGQCNVDDWTDIVAISAGESYTVGLKSDGTVVATGDNRCDQCNVDDWTDIVAISAGGTKTLGLKSDGTVVATGDKLFDQCNVDDWTDIVAISAGEFHTVGLKSDGTIVAVGSNGNGQCKVGKLK